MSSSSSWLDQKVQTKDDQRKLKPHNHDFSGKIKETDDEFIKDGEIGIHISLTCRIRSDIRLRKKMLVRPGHGTWLFNNSDWTNVSVHKYERQELKHSSSISHSHTHPTVYRDTDTRSELLWQSLFRSYPHLFLLLSEVSNMNSSGSGEIINVECDVLTPVKEETSGNAKFSAGLRRIPFNEACFIFLFPLSDYYLTSYFSCVFTMHKFSLFRIIFTYYGEFIYSRLYCYRCLRNQPVPEIKIF
ncbi:hypothetical protein YC2023_048989 [Brassica napus]